MLSPTARFSNRVSDYVKYRPGYPVGVLHALEEMAGLKPEWKVADIGSGTGKLAELFLRYGLEVTGVEPNREMREAAEILLSQEANFVSLEATAEQTGLPDNSFDLVTAGQAFHWFDAEKSKIEFRRILKPGGGVALIWNDRKTQGTPFLDGYEQLLRSLPEYVEVGHKTEGAMKLKGFFESESMQWATPNQQDFEWEGLLGRALSSSYVPAPGDAGHDAFKAQLHELYAKTEAGGKVSFLYETQVFVSRP